MALEEYRRKRDFKKTAEPAPSAIKKNNGQLSYLIQKHEATRLHYDFRLELNGVLLSWAVTKGPSLNPADKRLAVRTEDHPLAYGTFEGTIPKGQYGGGTVMLWDRGWWEPQGDAAAGLKGGNFKFILHGERLNGKWALIRMHGKPQDKGRENWLLIKEKDEVADAARPEFLDELAFSVSTARKMEEIAAGAKAGKALLKKDTVNGIKKLKKSNAAASRSEFVVNGDNVEKLMMRYPDVELATLVDAPPSGEDWVHEVKFDGYRLLAFLDHGAVRLRTRNGNDWTDKFPSLRTAVASLNAENAVLDLEAVVIDAAGRTSFQGLQHALGGERSAAEINGYVFDLLHLDGEDLRRENLLTRKKKLLALLKKSKEPKFLHYSEHIHGHGAEMLEKSRTLGLEGIISKQASAPYRAGRQRSWLKAKCILRQEFIILGYSAPKKGDRALGALYLGYYQDKKLAYAGKVGTGFTMRDAMELQKKLSKLAQKDAVLKKSEMTDVFRAEYDAVKWSKPQLLCEVAFTERTENGHIRHPSFQGLREDKDATNVKLETPESVTRVIKKPAKSEKLKTQKAGKVSISSHSGNLNLSGVTITHPDRVIGGKPDVTKGELAEFYAAAAPFILRDLSGHPMTLVRCPGGIGGECFYQRNPGRGLGPDILPFKWDHNGSHYEYFYMEQEAGLLEAVQMGAIELHPWGSTVERIDYPDRLIFDLDPDPTVPFEAVKLAAEDLRRRLQKKGLESFLRCTGGKGLHITVPIKPDVKWPAAKAWCAAFAAEMVAAAPDAYIATMSKAKRTGKIFIDFFRNDYTATAICDFSVRARPGMPVAVPLEWRELKALKSGDQFKIPDALQRLKKGGPDLARYARKQRLPR